MKRKILLVDDDQFLLRLYRMILHHIGYNSIYCANNGFEAVEMVRNCEIMPSFIIMDHRMPRMNGIEAMKRILEFDHTIKFIFASADTSIREEAIKAGAIVFLGKPFEISHLRKIIAEVIT